MYASNAIIKDRKMTSLEQKSNRTVKHFLLLNQRCLLRDDKVRDHISRVSIPCARLRLSLSTSEPVHEQHGYTCGRSSHGKRSSSSHRKLFRTHATTRMSVLAEKQQCLRVPHRRTVISCNIVIHTFSKGSCATSGGGYFSMNSEFREIEALPRDSLSV